MIQRISIFGAGRLATALGHLLRDAGLDVVMVYNRSEHKGRILADALDADYTAKPMVPKGTDLLILAVSDDHIQALTQAIEVECLVVHCSGMRPMADLNGSSDRIGVFYPLQSFDGRTNNKPSEVPILIEAALSTDAQLLSELAERLGCQHDMIASDERKKLHVSAVLLNNFLNHQLALLEEYLADQDLDPSLLRPLLERTLEDRSDLHRFERQTGPAIRKDQGSIDEHLQMLKDHQQLKAFYAFMTESISKTHHKDE